MPISENTGEQLYFHAFRKTIFIFTGLVYYQCYSAFSQV